MKITKLNESLKTGIAALIYASPKSGKTFSLKYLQGKTLIIDVDHGTSVLADCPELDIDIVHVSVESSISSIIEELEGMESIPYKNIVLDSLTELENQILTNFAKKGKNDGIPEMSAYLKLDFAISDICRRLRNLTAKGVNIIITTWESLGELIQASGEKVSVVKPMIRKPELLCGLMSIVARLEISQKDGITRYFRFAGSNSLYAGDRIYKRQYAKINELLGEVKDGN